jgi:hypothetical protein
MVLLPHKQKTGSRVEKILSGLGVAGVMARLGIVRQHQSQFGREVAQIRKGRKY